MWQYLIASFILSFLFLYFLWKRGGIGKYVEDHNKPQTRKVPVGGGIIVVIITSFLYLAFGFNEGDSKFIMISVASMIIVAFLIGLYDDLKGIHKWKKVPILGIAAIPIIIISAYLNWNLWESAILGINFSIIYWILIIPIVVAGFANGGNVIAGYDGMETGVYTLIAVLYLLIGFIQNSTLIIVLSGVLFFSLLAMLYYNWYPSKLLLGNVGSFAISATLGIIPLIGHFEIILPIVFLPHIIEALLQLKYTRHYNYDVFGDVDKYGIIHNRYGIKSVIHWIISWGNMTEKKITLTMLGIEALLCGIAFFVWYIWYFEIITLP